MEILKMERKDFYTLPYKEHIDTKKGEIGEATSFVILPINEIDKDYGCQLMEVVPCIKGKPLYRLPRTYDVLILAGNEQYWFIDCLPKSGLLRFFLPEGLALSIKQALFSDQFIRKEKEE